MFYPRLLLLIPHLLLLLTTGATSAPLPGTACLSCPGPALAQPPTLKARVDPPGFVPDANALKDSDVLGDIYNSGRRLVENVWESERAAAVERENAQRALNELRQRLDEERRRAALARQHEGGHRP
ncbi:hypothetical protein A4X06_0g4889 [Tilletia controversa]|uniref:Uncharacterized protein n=2 Tax=Tilletia TaxID=13289 RepID=A0A8X7MS07_9BASI|nr:hypothetical protein CF336_g4640 [Tilletia laevis]KAE8195898.1 hypothetical protein CF328_g4299 [Tilletia controversa]KAE8200991.1 hypothetical protein CF335_g3836 [Tilletia laevis]KAE8246764.1 hypothetical protein A4X06_0g4889 [Tilletia controversa]KAE8259768.1 hypothetical protein A4X03_0g4003 [Tilletia caries]